jgi:sterol desaturase/sphingolipid hydroxylase (fatty acid hydroxylase superfamily)
MSWITDSTVVARLTCVLCAVIVALCHEEVDESLQSLYVKMLDSAYFQHDSVEVVQSTVCFGVFITAWYITDLTGICSHYRFGGTSSNDLKSWKGRERALLEEVVWYALPWLLFHQILPGRRHEGLLTAAAATMPTVRMVCLQTLSSLFVYDVLFYTGHRLMHSVPALYSYHAKHHTMGGKITATDAVRHGFVDGTFDVLSSVVALKVVHSHPMSRLMHNVVATWLIAEAHSGYDLPWSCSRITGGLFISPKLHAKHHERGHVMYAKFFPLLDVLLGTAGGQINDLQELF